MGGCISAPTSEPAVAAPVMVTRQTVAYDDQKPGTSGLRKKVKVFQQKNYLENFVQATFNALDEEGIEYTGGALVVSGDGRYWMKHAIQVIVRIALANGVKEVIVGVDGLMSTPAVSAVVRRLRSPEGALPFGAFILTASHNPGGPENDFGIKYNGGNGAPAPESLTAKITDHTKTLKQYRIAENEVTYDLSKPGLKRIGGGRNLVVIDAAALYVELMEGIFDFEALRAFLQRKDFTMVYDGMHGVAGPFAKAIFVDKLGLDDSVLQNCEPKQDFGGGHPDPNLTYAKDLVEKMGMGCGAVDDSTPDFGAAADGDADRNMILGKGFFVTPSDSVAVLAANAQAAIPYFKDGLKGVARSMPTSGALDRVAEELAIKFFEVPTGWKFFGNLMDSDQCSICGEESFGTGSDHVREKDGIWAVLAWLSVLAHRNPDASEPLVSVETIVREHWKTYGRNFYCRYDYEEVDSDKAKHVMAHLVTQQADLGKLNAAIGAMQAPANKRRFFQRKVDVMQVKSADEFEYTDPVDGSFSQHQGIRFLFEDGSRIIFRLSGTGSVGATIRLYIEQYVSDSSKHTQETADALKTLVTIALGLSDMEANTGRKEPTVIT
eukprot:PRCOL_00001548-RA